MRITGGNLKGRRFAEKVPAGIRPTSDFVRVSIFNTLGNYIDFEEGFEAADIFAGTGALGFEALSRGCKSCTFYEKCPKNSFLIKSVAEAFQIESSRYRIIIGNVFKTLPQFKMTSDEKKFGLIFSDPPYNLLITNKTISIINDKGLLKAGGIIVAEHSLSESVVVPEGMRLYTSKKYGDTQVDFLFKIKLF